MSLPLVYMSWFAPSLFNHHPFRSSISMRSLRFNTDHLPANAVLLYTLDVYMSSAVLHICCVLARDVQTTLVFIMLACTNPVGYNIHVDREGGRRERYRLFIPCCGYSGSVLPDCNRFDVAALPPASKNGSGPENLPEYSAAILVFDPSCNYALPQAGIGNADVSDAVLVLRGDLPGRKQGNTYSAGSGIEHPDADAGGTAAPEPGLFV